MTLKVGEVHLCVHLGEGAVKDIDVLIFLAQNKKHPRTLDRDWECENIQSTPRAVYLYLRDVLEHYSPTVPLSRIPPRVGGSGKRFNIRITRAQQDVYRESAGAVALTTWAEGVITCWLADHADLIADVHGRLQLAENVLTT